MNTRVPQSAYNERSQANWTAAELIENNPRLQERSSPLSWWYRWTAPPEVPSTASFNERELARRGRLTSAVLLAVVILGLVPVFTSILTKNRVFIPSLLISLVFDGVALWLNRRGNINAAGIVALLVVSGGIIFNILSVRGGMDISLINLFDLLVQGELIAVSLLPARSVFGVMLANILFFFLVITFAPHTHAMGIALATRGYSVLLTPTILQVIVAVVTYLWVDNTTKAIKRADRAEVIAALEHTLAEQSDQIAAQKEQLEEGIQQLVQVHAQAANGNLSSRAALPADRTLWPLAGSLNTLLMRFQRALQNEVEQQQTRKAASLFFEALNQAKGGPMRWQRTGTYFDQIAQQYNYHHRSSERATQPPVTPKPRKNSLNAWDRNAPV
jgi:hypothetical protein